MSTTFVLVGGAWMGGWAWQTASRDLRGRGHDVYPVTLTGLGERSHLAGPEVTLETHITDVVNLILWEDLREVVLVGHSYSGIVVTGVADRVGERLAAVAYVDSGPFEDGESFLGVSPPDARQALAAEVATGGDGWRMRFPGFAEIDASLEGLGSEERARMEAKFTDHPFGTYTQPLRLIGSTQPAYRRMAIACNDFRSLIAMGIPRFQAMTVAPWEFRELATGHWPMLSTPTELVAVLDELATAQQPLSAGVEPAFTA